MVSWGIEWGKDALEEGQELGQGRIWVHVTKSRWKSMLEELTKSIVQRGTKTTEF